MYCLEALFDHCKSIDYYHNYLSTLVSVSPEVLPSPSLVSSEILSPSQSPMPNIVVLPFLELNATISVVRFLRGAVDSSELVVAGQQLVIGENIVNRIYVSHVYH